VSRRFSPAICAILAMAGLADPFFRGELGVSSAPVQTGEEKQRALARAEAKRERRRKKEQ